MDIEERLTWLDEEYLSHYDANEVEVHSQIQLQKPFDAVVSERRTYPITEDEPEEKHTYLSYNKVVGTVLDRELYQAFSILDYVLVSAPGAPVRQALIDAGIGEDVYGSFEDGMLQPMFSIVAKNADESDQTRFVQIIEETLQKLVKEGLNQDSLLAGINSAEFRFREADYGQFPKGLLYGLQCMESWLFDDTKPFIHLECLDTLQFLREQIKTGYFEDLIQKYLLDNAHGAVVVVAPEKGLNRAKEQALADKLAAYKAGLSDEEVQALIAQTRHLREYQEEPSKEEDLLKIPMLGREDMKKEAMTQEERKAQEEKEKKQEKAMMGGTVAFSIVFALGLFFFLPYFLSGIFHKVIASDTVIALLEGLIRLAIFIGYIALISLTPDIKRVFMYHGAEHKCINCIEHGMELNVENVRKSSRQHKRCGTSFLLIVMLISIVFFLFIRVDSRILQLVLRLLLIPVIAGVSYEFIRLAGRYDNRLVNILSKPGLWMQKMTTREPDDEMIEVGIASVEAVFDWRKWQKEENV